jgi:hypothetical protein
MEGIGERKKGRMNGRIKEGAFLGMQSWKR